MSNSHGRPRRFGAGKVLISLVAAETAVGPYLADWNETGVPDGASWEVYTVLADSQTFFSEDEGGPGCCGGASEADAGQSGEPAASAAKCC